MAHDSTTPTPLEQTAAIASARRSLSIGLPRCNDAAERRFPLTPEGAEMLVEQGFDLYMERDAASTIHYPDNRYTAAGVHICPRNEALACDIVIHLAPLSPDDIKRMRRGAMLLTLLSLNRLTRESIEALLSRHIITIAIDLISDNKGNLPFADILAEIDGRAAMARAASLLADSVHGKGILLGGVTGITPCEVTVIGSGIAACAAAKSAAGAGALVRVFDNDVYRLRQTERELDNRTVTSALHPRVFENALRTADVVIYTGIDPTPVIDSNTVGLMKRGVIIFDLSKDCGKAFPSVPTIDLALASPLDISLTEPSRACYINAGNAVARTAAMALSNTFATMLHSITDNADGFNSALRMVPGLQSAALTFLGKPTNADIAALVGRRCIDIGIYLTLS